MIDEWKDRAAHRPLEDRVGSVTLSSQALNEALHPRPETDWPLEEGAEQAEAPRERAVLEAVNKALDEQGVKGGLARRHLEDRVLYHLRATQPPASPEQAEAPSDAAREVLAAGIVHHYGVPEETSFACARRVLALATQPTASIEQAEAPSDVADEFAHSKYASTTARNIALLDEIERLRAIQPATSKTAPASRPEFVSLEEHDRILQAVRQPTASNAGERDGPSTFRKCEHCGCETNAKMRACCKAGWVDDKVASETRAALATKPPAGEQKPVFWQPIRTAPRDGKNILLRWGIDGVSQGKYVPGLTHPWKFVDTNDGITWLINHCIDGPGGPSHWAEMPDENTTAPQPDQVAQDCARLDWLCEQYVTVRIPLRYGSKECFLGSPDDNDGEPTPWDIRSAIDAARARGEGGDKG